MRHSDEPHLLILGSPRSGTTLLAAMIGAHSDIAILNEDTSGGSRLILSKRIAGVKLCIPNQIELDHTRSMRLRDVTVARFQRYLANPMRHMLGIRTPVPITPKSRLSIRDFQNLVSELYIVAMIRNPIDVVNSIMRRGQQSRATAEYRWRRTIEVLYELKQTASENLTLVTFDSLVLRPRDVLTSVLAQMGCEFQEVMLEGYRHTQYYANETQIDASKASSDMTANASHAFLQDNGRLHQMYEDLLREAL